MFILNKSTGVVQECHNDDVIRVCRKDAEHYTVAETKKGAKAGGQETGGSAPDENPVSTDKMTVAELRELAEKNGIEGCDSLTKKELLSVLKGVV